MNKYNKYNFLDGVYLDVPAIARDKALNHKQRTINSYMATFKAMAGSDGTCLINLEDIKDILLEVFEAGRQAN